MKSEAKASAVDIPCTVKLRQILLQIISRYDEQESVRRRDAATSVLIDVASTYKIPPRAVEIVVQQATQLGEKFFLDDGNINGLTAVCEDWYRGLVKERPSTSLQTLVPPPVQVHAIREKKTSRPTALPREATRPWREVVMDGRSALLDFPPRGLWKSWGMPRKIWSSLFVEAYRVASFKGDERRRGLALVPTLAAAEAAEGYSWWKYKVETARRLKDQAQPDSRLANVIDHADPTNPGFVLLDFTPPIGTLAEYFSKPQGRPMRDDVEAALAWCDFLGDIGRRGVLVADLPPALISQRWSIGQRMVYLADPTAVIPNSVILPVVRSGPRLPSAGQYRELAPDQVFLVGALLIASIRRELSCLEQSIATRGGSASLASLAGLPNLATRTSAELLPSVLAGLERHPKPDGIDLQKLAEVLRWSLAEARSERYPTLKALSGNLRDCLQ